MANPTDQQRAAEIVTALPNALEPYRDYRKAIEDGYEPFSPKQTHYHFTNKWRRIEVRISV